MTRTRRDRGTAAALTAAAPVFAALGDQTRLHLIARLGAEGRLSIARLTAGTDLTRQAVTKHLHVLSGAGLAQSVPRGRERLWQLRPGSLDEVRRSLEVVSRQWDETLDRLKAAVEEP